MKRVVKRTVVSALVVVLAVLGLCFRLPESAAADNLTATWIDVTFTQPMRVKWDWKDLFTDAVTADRSMGLSVAGLVLSQAAEISRANAEAELAKLGFENPYSEYYLLSTEDKNDITQPARTFGHKAITKERNTISSALSSRELRRSRMRLRMRCPLWTGFTSQAGIVRHR